jgi:hypothetical protein
VVAVLGAGTAGCAEEDYGPFRPPGGGGTGVNTGGDARPPDAGLDGGGGLLRGRVCIVTDLRQPDACPADPLRADVAIAVQGTGATAFSDDAGDFVIAADGVAVLDVAAGSATLQRATVPVAVTGASVNAPVVTRAAYTALLGAIGTPVPDGGGAVALYVMDSAGPESGVSFSTVAGSSIAPFYDDGGPLAWVQGGGTGAAGVALFFDVPVGTVVLDGVTSDQRMVRLTGVPVVVDAVTFVRVMLAPP